MPDQLPDKLAPDVMPVLSRGRHRNPRKGACLMELTSYLAGEPWSDHPRCTHPLVACLAREVNDNVRDASRSRLARMIPDLIGLDGDDPRADVWIAREAALCALAVAPAERQCTAAVGVLSAERALNALEGRPLDHLSEHSRACLDDVPHARDWAIRFTAIGLGGTDTFRRRSAPAIVHSAVSGIAGAAVSDPDDLLVDLLARTIAMCRRCFDVPRSEPTSDEWAAMSALTTR